MPTQISTRYGSTMSHSTTSLEGTFLREKNEEEQKIDTIFCE